MSRFKRDPRIPMVQMISGVTYCCSRQSLPIVYDENTETLKIGDIVCSASFFELAPGEHFFKVERKGDTYWFTLLGDDPPDAADRTPEAPA